MTLVNDLKDLVDKYDSGKEENNLARLNRVKVERLEAQVVELQKMITDMSLLLFEMVIIFLWFQYKVNAKLRALNSRKFICRTKYSTGPSPFVTNPQPVTT